MADRLISADKLKKEIVDWKVKTQSQNQDYNTGYFSALSAVEGILAYASTVDAVEVVRCKDCKHRADELETGNYLCNRKMIGMVRPNDFCSFGEREDNG